MAITLGFMLQVNQMPAAPVQPAQVLRETQPLSPILDVQPLGRSAAGELQGHAKSTYPMPAREFAGGADGMLAYGAKGQAYLGLDMGHKLDIFA